MLTPCSRAFSADSFDYIAFSQVLTDNAALTKTDSAFMKAKIEYTTVASNGQGRPRLASIQGHHADWHLI